MLKIDGLRLRAQQIKLAPRIIVALLEGLESGCRLAFEAERGGDFVPVKFQGGGALENVLVESHASIGRSG